MKIAPYKMIPRARLSRMGSDLYRVMRRNPADGPVIKGFAYDHSNTLITDSDGKQDLLIENTRPLASDIARLLQHCAPETIDELLRGYLIAMHAGLLDPKEAMKELPAIPDSDEDFTPQKARDIIRTYQRVIRKITGTDRHV